MNTTTRIYKVFGLIIQSEIELPELLKAEADSEIDIFVKNGDVTEVPSDQADTVHANNMALTHDSFYQRVPEVVDFFVKHKAKTHITVDVKDLEKMYTVYAYLYGSIFSAALNLNNQFALHASAAVVDGKLNLFCGESGIGKSTLAMRLNNKGYRLFSDDKCVLRKDLEADCFLVEPTIQIVRLWDDATEKLSSKELLADKSPIIDKANKYQYKIAEEDMMKEPMPISKIYILQNISEDKTLKCIELKGMAKLALLHLQAHRRRYINGFGKSEIFWKFLSDIIAEIPVYVVRRPENTPIEKFVDFIEDQF